LIRRFVHMFRSVEIKEVVVMVVVVADMGRTKSIIVSLVSIL